MAKTALRFKNLTVPSQPGELGRIRVVGGPDVGTVFVLLSPKISIGRGEENDVVLSDLSMSRRHAELAITGAQNARQISIIDLGSANGIVINGVASRQSALRTGDKIGIGKSMLEYLSDDAGSLLQQEPLLLNAASITGIPGIGSNSKIVSAPKSFVERNKKMVLIVGGLVLVATLLPSVEEKQRKKKNAYLDPKEVEAERSLSSLPPPQVLEDSIKSADRYFKEGYREFRTQNYTRALVDFDTALQIYSAHPLAKIYRESTIKAMEKEAKDHFELARRDEEANRMRSAMLHYEAAQRLYVKDQTHKLYQEAVTHLEDLKKKIKDGEALK